MITNIIRLVSLILIGVGTTVFTVLHLPIPPTPIHGAPHENVVSTTSLVQEGRQRAPMVATTTDKREVVSLKSAENPKEVETVPVVKKTEPAPRVNPSSNKAPESPYTFPPHDASTLNNEARAALVNILCESSSRSFESISGSGVTIDSRGVILTNAHIGQFVLLSEAPEIPLSCLIRTGSPAKTTWHAHLLYISPAWIQKHASDIEKQHVTGTGEDDYALLYVVDDVTGTLPATFPYIPVDIREAIAQTDQSVLVAAYPAEFSGPAATLRSLYATVSGSFIKDVFTFRERTLDIISLGATPLAQAGSSGGAVINAWGRLVGIIVTTTEGATTGTRDLRAITLAHINRSFQESVGLGLPAFLEGEIPTLHLTLTKQNETLRQTLIENTALKSQ